MLYQLSSLSWYEILCILIVFDHYNKILLLSSLTAIMLGKISADENLGVGQAAQATVSFSHPVLCKERQNKYYYSYYYSSNDCSVGLAL